MSLPYDIATKEMDKIVYVNQWLSIKVSICLYFLRQKVHLLT